MQAFLRQYQDFMQILLLVAGVVNQIATGEWSTTLLLIGLTVAQGLAQGSGNLMLRSMAADIADNHRLETGHDRTALFFSTFSISMKAGMALAMGVALPLVAAAGFDPAAPTNSPQALQVRSVEEMALLRERGLTLYYLGIESGHDLVLQKLVKGVDAAEMVRVASKAHEAGVALSTMILLGAGGPALSLEHARASASVLNAIQPRFVSTLIMTPVAGTPLLEEARRGVLGGRRWRLRTWSTADGSAAVGPGDVTDGAVGRGWRQAVLVSCSRGTQGVASAHDRAAARAACDVVGPAPSVVR